MKTVGDALRLLRVISAALSLVLSGCAAHPLTDATQASVFARGSLLPATYLEALDQEYGQIIAAEKRRYDWSAAHHFEQKRASLRAGSSVAPEDPKAWSIADPGLVRDLGKARKCLTILIPDVGDNGQATAPACELRTREPMSMAHALARFDCWVESGSDATPSDTGAPCRSEFMASLAYLADSAERSCSKEIAASVTACLKDLSPTTSSRADPVETPLFILQTLAAVPSTLSSRRPSTNATSEALP
ncbi:MAG TPA: hypothetical protein VM639_22480 [Dongiaceae bacterium]|nr:hypothetical protein [Dongiaceae bacterium]